MPLLDAAKGIACAVIVGHHLSRYGPMPAGAYALAPDFFAWLANEGRLAVQVFLVIAGFLAAASLAPDGRLRCDRPVARILQRYGRLVMPYLAALTVCVLVAALVRPWLDEEVVPASPTMGQLIAHGLLLQDLLGYESLSTGVWYVAIDFQLFALALTLVGLPAMLQRSPGSAPMNARARWLPVALVFGLAVASLALFNRNAGLDDTAFYFFGTYGLGMLVFWIGRATRFSTWQSAVALLALVGGGCAGHRLAQPHRHCAGDGVAHRRRTAPALAFAGALAGGGGAFAAAGAHVVFAVPDPLSGAARDECAGRECRTAWRMVRRDRHGGDLRALGGGRRAAASVGRGASGVVARGLHAVRCAAGQRNSRFSLKEPGASAGALVESS
jgi:peptidoglycan/LPS O-acetylase OafA/YrhL